MQPCNCREVATALQACRVERKDDTIMETALIEIAIALALCGSFTLIVDSFGCWWKKQ